MKIVQISLQLKKILPFLGSSNHPLDYVLEIVAYEARRLFRDKIVGVKELHLFDNILTSVLQGDWGSDILDNMAGNRRELMSVLSHYAALTFGFWPDG